MTNGQYSQTESCQSVIVPSSNQSFAIKNATRIKRVVFSVRTLVEVDFERKKNDFPKRALLSPAKLLKL